MGNLASQRYGIRKTALKKNLEKISTDLTSIKENLLFNQRVCDIWTKATQRTEAYVDKQRIEAEIHKLNDDCLMHIFSYIPIADRLKLNEVCKRWRNIGRQPWWTFNKLDLKEETWGLDVNRCEPKQIIPIFRNALLYCGALLTHIDFSDCTSKLSDEAMSSISKHCKNLKCININVFWISPDKCETDLSSLFLQNEKLRHLKLRTTFSITGNCLLNLPADSLEALVIETSYIMSAFDFDNIVKDFEKLCKTVLKKCGACDDRIYNKVYRNFQKAVALERTIHTLSIKSLFQLSPGVEFNKLQMLDVQRNIYINDQCLKEIASKCKQLKNVNISWCNKVSNKGLVNIVSLPKLQHLDISCLTKITDEVLTNMPNLRTMICCKCEKLENQGLGELIKNSPNIELLDFTSCEILSNELIEIAIKATKNRTNNVILRMYVTYTNIEIKEITRASPFLQILNGLSKSYIHCTSMPYIYPQENAYQ